MCRILALDIDGILIQHNKFFSIFENFSVSLWLGEKQWLKKILLRIFEIVEFCFLRLFKRRYQLNSELVFFLNDIKAHNENLCFFIITDRSAFGLKNVWPELSALNLNEGDFIQVRGQKKISAQKKKLAEFLKTNAEILFSSSVKPHKKTILSLVLVASRLKPKEVWLWKTTKIFCEWGRRCFLIFVTLKHSRQVMILLLIMKIRIYLPIFSKGQYGYVSLIRPLSFNDNAPDFLSRIDPAPFVNINAEAFLKNNSQKVLG